MTNMKRHYLRSTLALLMSILMVVSILPMNVFAAVPKANWSDQTNDPNYDFWPLAAKNQVKLAGTLEPMRSPGINYRGTYKYKRYDGQVVEVVRMSFSYAKPAGRPPYRIVALKLPSVFNEMVNYTSGKTGFYKGVTANVYSDSPKYSEITSFKSGNKEDFGADVVYTNLDENGNFSAIGKIDIPFQFELEPGKSIKDLAGDITIQARLYNNNFTEVLSRLTKKTAGGTATTYNSYTYTTTINQSIDLKPMLQTDYLNMTNFHSSDSYIKYNEEEGYIDVLYKQGKDDTSILWEGDNYALFQSFDTDFREILRPKSDGTVAVVTIASTSEEFYGGTLNDAGEFLPARSVSLKMNHINTSENVSDLDKRIAFIKVSGKKWYESDQTNEKLVNQGVVNDMFSIGRDGVKTRLTDSTFTNTIINGTVAWNIGVATIVRYYVDKDKIDELAKKGQGLSRFNFFSSYVVQATDKHPNYTYTYTMKNDRDLKKGHKINIYANDINYGSYMGNKDVVISIHKGTDEKNKVEFRSSTTGGKNSFVFELPFDIYLEKGDVVSITLSENQTLRIQNLETYDVTVSGKRDYRSKIIGGSDTLTGGLLELTYAPVINEIFTDSKNITGYTKYHLAEITATDIDDNYQDWSASNQSVDVEVDNEQYKGYKFDTSKVNPDSNEQINEYEEFKMPELTKDMPIKFKNTHIMGGAIPSIEVVEQVQARIYFDLNEGTLPLDIKSYQGINEEGLPGTKLAYLTRRSNDTDNVVRIAPMNEKFSNEADYTANGFEGPGVIYKDHNGGELTGDAKTLREFLKDEPTKQGLEFYGWTTKKVDTLEEFENLKELKTQAEAEGIQAEIDANNLNNQIEALSKQAKELRAKGGTASAREKNEEEAKKLDAQANALQLKLDSLENKRLDQTFIFTKTSPIVSTMTVYAFYGPEKSAVYNPEQKYDEDTDKQYIDATPEDPDKTASPTATYTLVKKTGEDENGKPVYETVVTSTEKKDGKPIFDISGDDVVDGGEYYVETKDGDKAPSYSTRPVVVDKEQPKESTTQGEEIKAIPDLFNYMVKITGKATDADNKILKATVEANGKTVDVTATINNDDFSIVLNDDTLQQLGEAKEYKVTIYDIMGNKLEKTLTVQAVAQDLVLEIEDLLADDSEILLKSKTNAALTIRVIRKNKDTGKNQPINLDAVTATSDEFEAIDLKQDGAEFTLEAGDRIIIDSKLDGYKDARIMRLVK